MPFLRLRPGLSNVLKKGLPHNAPHRNTKSWKSRDFFKLQLAYLKGDKKRDTRESEPNEEDGALKSVRQL